MNLASERLKTLEKPSSIIKSGSSTPSSECKLIGLRNWGHKGQFNIALRFYHLVTSSQSLFFLENGLGRVKNCPCCPCEVIT